MQNVFRTPVRAMNVVVIGAGAAGLCAAKLLAERKDVYKFVVFEQSANLGGIWKYTDKIGGAYPNGLPLQSSMYKNLRTNLPKEVMAFPDFPFPDFNGRSYLHHTEMLQYLKDYASYFHLERYLKFNTKVEKVKPKPRKNSERLIWEVSTIEMSSKKKEFIEFDAVILCVGHYSSPKYPELSGLSTFTGKVLHSQDYRTNEPFKDLTVVLLGASSSGIDLALEVGRVAKEVYLSHDLSFKWLTQCSDKALNEVPGISCIQNETVTFKDGRSCAPDVLILCTGYNMNLNLLHPECKPTEEEGKLTPLYKHMIHIHYPTLAILGVPMQVIPFVIYQQQLLFFLKTLSGSVILRKADEMIADANDDFESRLRMGMPRRHAHKMSGDLQWKYLEDLTTLGSLPPVPDNTRKIYERVSKMRKENSETYRDFQIIVKNKDSFEIRRIGTPAMSIKT